MKKCIIILFSSVLLATTITIPTDYPTIQEGIIQSSDGDTVLVLPGTYIELLDYQGRDIVVGSLYLTTADTSYIGLTIVDALLCGSVVTFDSGETAAAELVGLTITHGSGTNSENQVCGGGIFCLWSSPTLRAVSIESNGIIGSTAIGGGIYIWAAENMQIIDSRIFWNSGYA